MHVSLAGAHIRIEMLGEARSLFIGYRAGRGYFLVSNPSDPPGTFFSLDSATVAGLLPSGSARPAHERAAERLRDHLLFVSYARHDEAIIKPLVALLRVAGPVFRDEDSLRPGDIWHEKIQAEIDRCTEFLLFWCAHSADSAEVRREYELALRLNKRVVPVLLDGSDLRGPLRARQWIDMRPVHRHQVDESEAAGARGATDGPTDSPRSLVRVSEDAALFLAEELGGMLLEPEQPEGKQASVPGEIAASKESA